MSRLGDDGCPLIRSRRGDLLDGQRRDNVFEVLDRT